MIHLPQYDFLRQERLGQEGQLIPLLQRAQQVDGYLQRERLLEIHRQTGVPLASIYGVATFYAQFRLSPVGKHLIRVCHGTAATSRRQRHHRRHREHLQINTGDTTPDRLFTLETVSCLGCCSLAPVIMIDNATHGNLTDRKVIKVLKQYQQAAAAPTEVAP